jgi:hypothetical protein
MVSDEALTTADSCLRHPFAERRQLLLHLLQLRGVLVHELDVLGRNTLQLLWNLLQRAGLLEAGDQTGHDDRQHEPRVLAR